MNKLRFKNAPKEKPGAILFFRRETQPRPWPLCLAPLSCGGTLSMGRRTSFAVPIVFRSAIKGLHVWSSVCLPRPPVASFFTDGLERPQKTCLSETRGGETPFSKPEMLKPQNRDHFQSARACQEDSFCFWRMLVCILLEVGSLQLRVNARGGVSHYRGEPRSTASSRQAQRGSCRPPSSSARSRCGADPSATAGAPGSAASRFRQYPDGIVMAAIRDSQAMGTMTGIPCERGRPDLLGCRRFWRDSQGAKGEFVGCRGASNRLGSRPKIGSAC